MFWKKNKLKVFLNLPTVIITVMSLLGFLILTTFILEPPQKNHIVEITETGFSPNNLNLTQGDSITFINHGNWEHWPASNIHPTHLIYPEFDPKKSIKSGEEWTFKFEKIGSFRFHDHIFSTNTGQLMVLKNNSPAYILLHALNIKSVNFDEVKFQIKKEFYAFFPGKVQSELNSADIFKLVSADLPQLKLFIVAKGPQKVLDRLLTQSNGGATMDCHQESHQIGRLSYEVSGYQAFKIVDQSCHSGYMHGAMEAFLKDKGTDNLAIKIDQLCSSFSNGFSYFECLHGVGHGVMAFEDYDLPKSLTICGGLKDQFSQSSCYGGLFMENVIVAEGKGATPNHSTNWVSDDPYFPCNGVDNNQDIQTQCYLMQTSRMLDLYNYDFMKVAKACGSAPETQRETCFQSYGRDTAGQVLRNPQKIQALCSNIPTFYSKVCLKGALYVIIEFWGDRMTDQPQQLCRIQTSPEDKQFCYELLGNRLPQIMGENSTKIKQICSYSELEYVPSCLKSAGIFNSQ